jgi:hypothetical protein
VAEPNFTEAPERRPALGLGSELDLVGEHARQLGKILASLEQRDHARVHLARSAVASDVTLPGGQSFLGVGGGRPAQLGAPKRERLGGGGIGLARRSAFEHLAQPHVIARRFVEILEPGERFLGSGAVQERTPGCDLGSSIEPDSAAQFE